jgi:hypothetical protein
VSITWVIIFFGNVIIRFVLPIVWVARNKLSGVITEVNTSNFSMIGNEADFLEIVKAMDNQIAASKIATAVVKELAAASRTKEVSRP